MGKQWTELALKDLESALKRFGTYSFDDKGSWEVMDSGALLRDLRKMSSAEAAESLRDLALSDKHGGRGLPLARDLVGDMEDWDELFDQPGISEIYNGEAPEAPAKEAKPVPAKAAKAKKP